MFRQLLAIVLTILLLPLSAIAAELPPCIASRVTDFGAHADGKTSDTKAIQKAIDSCADNGGGTVFFPAGIYLSGSIHLKSKVTLWLDPAATLLASQDPADFDKTEELGFKNDADSETSYFHFALIWGENVEQIAIVGGGTVDMARDHRHGPKTIALKRCKYVTIRDVRLLNAPNYNISMLGTDFVNIDGVTILNGYCDGIDPDACQNVRISNCHIESFDDAIVPKTSFSLGERRATENVSVTNCYLATECNAFKLGTESGGDFKRIAVSNCVMSGRSNGEPASGGIALESVDGANIDGVVVSNITMINVRAPIFIRLGNRGRDMQTPVAGTLKNVSINNVVATDASLMCSVTGIPDRHVQDITLSDINITCKGGGVLRPVSDPVPENERNYPDPDMFDGLPGYGLYCRHVDGLTLRNLQVSFLDDFWRLKTERDKDIEWNTPSGVPTPSEPGNPSYALVCEDVSDLSIDALRAQPSPDGTLPVRFVDVRDAMVHGCIFQKEMKTFLEVVGASCTQIHLADNMTGQESTPYVLLSGATESSIIQR